MADLVLEMEVATADVLARTYDQISGLGHRIGFAGLRASGSLVAALQSLQELSNNPLYSVGMQGVEFFHNELQVVVDEISESCHERRPTNAGCLLAIPDLIWHMRYIASRIEGHARDFGAFLTAAETIRKAATEIRGLMREFSSLHGPIVKATRIRGGRFGLFLLFSRNRDLIPFETFRAIEEALLDEFPVMGDLTIARVGICIQERFGMPLWNVVAGDISFRIRRAFCIIHDQTLFSASGGMLCEVIFQGF